MELWKGAGAGGEKFSFSFSAGSELEYTNILKPEYYDIIMREIAKEYEDDDELFEEDDYDFSDYGITEVLEHPERIDWEVIQGWIDDFSLEESFWEAMNEYPERDVIELLREHPQFSSLKDFDEDDLEDFIYNFVSNVLGTSRESYDLDEVDITEYVGAAKGKWDDLIYSNLTYNVIYDLKKMFQETCDE